jgi:hypothetical protein
VEEEYFPAGWIAAAAELADFAAGCYLVADLVEGPTWGAVKVESKGNKRVRRWTLAKTCS